MASSPPISLHSTALLPFLLLLPLLAAAQTKTPQNISIGSSLTPLGKATSWSSPSGDFAVGFRRLESNNSLFLLAVWFDKVASQTVVWVANRNQPVRGGAKFELAADGRLVLSDDAGVEVWSAGNGGLVANDTYAAMLDSGNFVLGRSQSDKYAWESFGQPMDTMLPSQTLQPGTNLLSRLMESDYSDGRFLLAVQKDGNLVFYPTAAPSCTRVTSCDNYRAYWASNTVGVGDRLVFNSAGDVNFTLSNGNSISITSAKSYSMGEFYQRATLDPDGVLRQYIYPRNGTGGGGLGGEWMVVASLPSNICMLRFEYGSGVCGFNSYCSQDSKTQMLTCECPPQYSFVDPDRRYKGCKPNFAPHSCLLDGGEMGSADQFQIVPRPNINWPFSDYEHLTPMDKDQCSISCLNDCFCVVAIHRDNGCWKKKLPLSNGMLNMGDVGTTALFKLPKGTYMSNNNTNMPQSQNPQFTTVRNGRTWLLVLLGGINGLLLVAVFLLTCCFYHKKIKNKLPTESGKLGTNLHSFTYKELKEATQGFKEELGKGAFGVVYKGFTESDCRTLIAVKRLHDLDEGVEKEFTNEVRAIAQTHHKNLIQLLGYCNEGPHRLLVYEYMSNGSLSSFLLGSMKPNWNTRTWIAFGVARGLLYLHEECSTQIIHCDIKAPNILLDDYFNAKISDFGLAKLLRIDQTRTNTGIRGTRGYVAPEWFRHMPITSKVDVYSFGVLLLEIICCRKNVESDMEEDNKIVLAYWAYDCFKEGRLDMLVENEEAPMADVRMLERLVMVAIWCIQEEPSLRPTMKKVTQMLEGAMVVPVPPDPSSYISSIN